MAVSSGSIINVNDIINRFKTNCETLIRNNSNQGSPYLPSGQLGSLPSSTTASLIGSSKNKINAATIVTNLTNFVRGLTRIRNYITYEYISGNKGNSLTYTSSGRKVFAATLASVSAVTRGTTMGGRSVTYTSGWTRSPSSSTATQSLSVSNPSISTNSTINANNLVTFFNNLYSAWATCAGNTITYRYYYCYNDCHTECHNSGRSRR
jgi:hypothetical protein